MGAVLGICVVSAQLLPRFEGPHSQNNYLALGPRPWSLPYTNRPPPSNNIISYRACCCSQDAFVSCCEVFFNELDFCWHFA
jgi:hypothetical protein